MKQNKKPAVKSKKHHWLIFLIVIILIIAGAGVYVLKINPATKALIGLGGHQQPVKVESLPSVSVPLHPEFKKLPVKVEANPQTITLVNNFKQFVGSPKPTKFMACPWSFTPSGNSLQLPNGFALSELHLAGVVCSNAQARCAYSSEIIDNILDMFTAANIYSIKTKALVGSTSFTAVASQGETWSNCQNDVADGSLGCRCELG